MRIIKSHPLISLANGYLIDSPQPSNLSYLWNFGSLLGFCLVIQIATGVTLAMHYNPSVLEAFNSVEHIMRDVNNGWLIRYLHSNTASAFFFIVYLHIGRGLYYGSYRAPRTLVWTLGTIIFITMMATAFLGYVLPYGQMSLWGKFVPQMYNLGLFTIFIVIINTITGKPFTKIKCIYRIGPHNNNIVSIIFGSLLGDAHAEKRSLGLGTRISFFQEHTHVNYVYYLHNLMSKQGYCNSILPKTTTRLGVNGKVRKVVRFHTWTYSSFNWIRDVFYINGRKCVPNNIGKYLTPLALAIWIMDDGAKVGKGMKFCTNSFTFEECTLLVKVLYDNFNIKSSVQSAGSENQYIIYVWKESMINLSNIVSPYIISEMKYKIT